MIWTYIKAYRFLKDYCPDIRNPLHKLRGFSGDGKPISFTTEDTQIIKKGLHKLMTQLLAKIDSDQQL